jgi:hypothetical protein
VALLATVVANSTATVLGTIAVEPLLVIARLGYTHPVVVVGGGGEVAHRYHKLVGMLVLANEPHHALVGVVAVDPLKPFGREIVGVEGGFLLVQGIEIGDKLLRNVSTKMSAKSHELRHLIRANFGR